MAIATLKQQRVPPLQSEGDNGWEPTGLPGQPVPAASALSIAARAKPQPDPRRAPPHTRFTGAGKHRDVHLEYLG